MPSTEITFCDRCNASIPEAAIHDGTAVIRNGRGYCNACAQTFRDGSFEDELHFCDSCNVSLSVGEIRDGQAFFKEGKLLCKSCHAELGQDGIATAPAGSLDPAAPNSRDDARGGEPTLFESAASARVERPRREGRIVRIAVSLVFLAAAITLSIFLIAFPERFGLGDPSEVASGSTERAVEGSESTRLEPGSPDDAATTTAPEPVVAEREEFTVDRETIDSLRGSLREIEDRLAALETIARSTDPTLAGRMETIEASIRDLQSDSVDSLEGVRSELGALRDAIRDVAASAVSVGEGEADPREATESDATDAETADAESTDAGEAVDTELVAILAKLDSAEAGQRFAALVELGRRGDVEHLPRIADVLLNDEDFVVREFAANVLGTFGSKKAVEPLVRALRDSAPSVVFAADEALQRITRKDFGMKRRSSSGARAEVVRRWESWWEKSGDDFR